MNTITVATLPMRVPLLPTQRTPDVDGTDVNVLDASYIGQPYHGEVRSAW